MKSRSWVIYLLLLLLPLLLPYLNSPRPTLLPPPLATKPMTQWVCAILEFPDWVYIYPKYVEFCEYLKAHTKYKFHCNHCNEDLKLQIQRADGTLIWYVNHRCRFIAPDPTHYGIPMKRRFNAISHRCSWHKFEPNHICIWMIKIPNKDGDIMKIKPRTVDYTQIPEDELCCYYWKDNSGGGKMEVMQKEAEDGTRLVHSRKLSFIYNICIKC